MDYEKKYKAVLEQARDYYNRVQTDYARKELENIFPELRESEDERIRKWLIKTIHLIGVDKDICADQETMDKAIAYLKKQKINTEGDFGRGYNCGYQAGYAIAKNEMNPKVAMTALDSEKQKEQKPAEKQDYSGLNDLERAILRSFLCAGVENVPVGIIKDTASECMGYLAFIEPKPTEWSEEDEDMLNSCISSIEEAKENRYAYKETDGDTSYDHEIAWLKLLRNRVGKEFLQPHWKPSEE